MYLVTLLALLVGVVAAIPQTLPPAPRNGLTLTTIDRWPYQANVLHSSTGVNFVQYCGGAIINNRSVLTAAHCVRWLFFYHPPNTFRLRLGSTFANSGGLTYNIVRTIVHPGYDIWTYDNDIVIMHSATHFSYSDVIQPGTIAGPNYLIAENENVFVAGWGAVWGVGSSSEHLHEVQLFTVSQQLCASKHGGITDNMLCTGYHRFGELGPCAGDSGAPIYHNRVVVGITSFAHVCPGIDSAISVNTRVSRFTSWIIANA